jgi:hypothetical protein
VIRVPIIGPGRGSGEAPPRGRAVRTGVSIGLALLGLIVALVRSRRLKAARPGPDPDRQGPARPADDAPIRPGWYGAVALVIAVLFAALSLFIYSQLDHWYRPVELSVQTNDPASGQQAMLGADTGPGVAWTLDGDVGQLTVVGPGSAEIMLPVPASQCGAVIARLGVGACGPQGVSLPSPAEFSWSTAQTLTSQGNDETAAQLELEPSAGAHGAQSLVMSVTNAVPTLCFAALTSATLTITVGRHHYVLGFPGFTTCSGLAATVSSPGPAAPSFDLTGLEGLTVTASAPTATLQGFTSQITLNPGGMSVQGAATVVALGSAGGSLSATLQVAPGSPALTLPDQPASSVMANGIQLVPSEWNRETVVFGPLLGGFVTVLVVTPLGLSLGVLTDALKRWPGPRRKDRGRGREGGSS